MRAGQTLADVIDISKLSGKSVKFGATATGDPLLLMSGLETDEGFGISADGTRLTFSRSPYYANLWLVEAGDARDGGRPVWHYHPRVCKRSFSAILEISRPAMASPRSSLTAPS